jgi:hypothetical protein
MNKNGMKWIRSDKRLAIYLRDGLACAYCGEGVEDGVSLTLDHLLPRSDGGDNDASNLITACHRCNSARGARSVAEFGAGVAAYLAGSAVDILAYVDGQVGQPLDIPAARALITARGGFRAALYGTEEVLDI